MESLTRGKDRIDINNLKEDENSERTTFLEVIFKL